jgi:hypothetical protein
MTVKMIIIIPLLVSGIYVKRYRGGMTVRGGIFVIPLRVSGISC